VFSRRGDDLVVRLDEIADAVRREHHGEGDHVRVAAGLGACVELVDALDPRQPFDGHGDLRCELAHA
jgi:hypothetical protein